MRKLITLFVAFEVLTASVVVLNITAQAETKKETALKRCDAKRDGCYRRCSARYSPDGDAVNRCGVRTCDFQHGNCKKETLSTQ